MIKTKVICDICGKDMSLNANSKGTEKIGFYITVDGTQLDMCEECKVAINKRVIHYSEKCKAPATDEVTEKSIWDEHWCKLKERLEWMRDHSRGNSSPRVVCSDVLRIMGFLEKDIRSSLKRNLEESEMESEDIEIESEDKT